MATGFISYPGIEFPQYIRRAVRTNGLRPNICILVAKPQSSPPMLHGDLVFGFNGTNVTWPNALCDIALGQSTDRGQSCMWTILDGRWRHWKAFITGAYNVRLDDGTIDPLTEKTLQEIVQLLFQAIGTTADVSAITSDEKPEVVFDHDRAVPELEEILEQRGYVASYQMDGTYKIYRVGSGSVIPNDGDVFSFANIINPPELPETLRARGARVRVQSKLHLTPVGIDIDGKIKKVNDLSYNPGGEGVVGGWDKKDMESFSYLAGKAQQLALMSVGKWYQVEFQANDDHEISGGGVDYAPGEITITDALQYLPLSDKLVTASVDVFGKKRLDLAFLEGEVYLDDDNPPKGKNSDKFSRIDRRDWSLDSELGIVKMKSVAKMVTDEGDFTFADLYLTCSYSVHDTVSHVKDRFLRDRPLGGDGMDQVNAEELERTLECQYGTDHKTINAIIDNEADVIAAADKLLDNVATTYATGLGNTVLYRVIRDYTTDGVNLQIVWTCAAPGSLTPWSTLVSQNVEAYPLAPRSKDRRQARQTERANLWNTSRGRRYRQSMKGKN